MKLSRLERRAIFTGILAAILLTILILLGSRGLLYFDIALLGYAVATIFAVFGITYRYVIWLHRPATLLYWKRGLQLFWNRQNFVRHTWLIPVTLIDNLLLQSFILKRGISRWCMHFSLMWGCVLAALVTFPLVFGWLTFALETPDVYRIQIFGFATFLTMQVRSLVGWLVFHILDISAILCLIGVTIALVRRFRDHGLLAIQRFGFDFVPLLLLLLVSITGLLITGVDLFLAGRFHSALSLIHMGTVVLLILYLPFGKFFHIVERPAAIGIELYQKVAEAEAQHACKRCGERFTSAMHAQDIKTTLNEIGMDFTFSSTDEQSRSEEGTTSATSLQDYCPRCKRILRGVAYTTLAKKQWI